ncbi:MAG TPA: hypothetical protein VKY85_17620 [Candidatus Angelobacter sp.]|nr:hypothetical protein [Candidatus Angelobacter sp.]
MKPATHEGISTEQQIFLGQLNQAIDQINQADAAGSKDQTALLLSAIARILVVQTAAAQNMLNRLAAFANKYSK